MIIQSERRKFPRFSVHIPVNLSVSGTEGETPLIAITLNASLNGILCKVDRYIPLSKKIQVSFAISESEQNTRHLTLQCEGTVVRITPEKEEAGRTEYTLVLNFDNLSQTERSILRTIISTARLTNLATSSVSVVVPVYNSQATLDELTVRIQAVLEPLVECFEIILVNDCSHDESWNEIIRLAAKNSNIRGLNLMRNYGQQNALLAGIQKAQYEIIVTLDDDLQQPPEEIPRLLSKLIEGYDVVYGKPAQRHHDTWRNISSKMFRNVLTIVLGSEIVEQISAFRAFRSILRNGFERFNDVQLVLDVLLSWSAARVTYIFVGHQPRQYGKSGYTLKKLMLLGFNVLTGYSILPLRIASGIGLITSFLGLVIFLYVVIVRLVQRENVPGFAFLASEIAVFAGILLFTLGIIGEYMARLHFRTMGKPPYVIRDEIGDDLLTVEKHPYLVEETESNAMSEMAEPLSFIKEK